MKNTVIGRLYLSITLLGSMISCVTHAASQENNINNRLFAAAKSGNNTQVMQLLQAGATVNHQNRYGATPLFYATQEGHTSTTQLLIARGAAVNHLNQYGLTPLFRTALKGHTATAQLLIAHGAAVNHQNQYGLMPLLATALKGHTSTAQLLIERGAAVNHRNQHGLISLFAAAQEGHNSTVRLLLARGAHWPKNPHQLIKDNANAFNQRKEAIESFLQKLDTNHNMPPDVLGLLKKYADVPEEHGPLGTGGRFKLLKRKRQHSIDDGLKKTKTD